MSNVDIAMRAKDEASQAFKSVETRLKELNTAIDTIKAKGDVNLHVRDVNNLNRLTSEVNKLERGLAQAGSTGEQAANQLASSFGGELQGILGGLGLGNLAGLATGAGIAAAAVGLGKVTIEAAQLGAQSLDTERSFNSVLKSVGQGPQALDALSAAAGGTISQLRLMQLTNTALAGASGELGNAFAAALPKLIEGARAANQLNPALGDTEFLFQSLVTGIKRGSPMLIDNTGITLKLGEANEKMAASLGKSAGELTEEEKKLAILNATMEGVDRLVQQAGGNLENMTSKQQAMKVATEELKTALGELVAKPYTVVIQQITKGISGAADAAAGTAAAGAALDTTSGADAQLAGVEKRLQYLQELRKRYQSGENLYRFNPASNEAEIESLTRLQAALTQYGGAANTVMAAQAQLESATARVADAQEQLANAVAIADQGEIELAQAHLNSASAAQRNAQALLDAATQSNAWGDAGAGAAARVAAALPAVKDGIEGVDGALAGSQEWWDKWAARGEAAAARAAQAVWTARAAMGQTGGARSLDDWLNRNVEASNAAWAARAAQGNARTYNYGDDPVKVWLDSQKTANKTAATDFARQYDQAAKGLATQIESYLSKAAGNAKGLFDLTGGQNDMMRPGANGPFENLYRLLDVAKQGDASPWAAQLGKSQEEARRISQDFQRGIFSPEVMGLVNVDQLVNEARLAQLAEKTQSAFAQQIAAKAGVGTNLVANLFGFGSAGAGQKTGAVAEESVAAALKQVAGAVGVSVKKSDFAGTMVGYGNTIWGYFEQGIVSAAQKSDGLQRAIDGMVAKSLAKNGGGSVQGAARASGVPGM